MLHKTRGIVLNYIKYKETSVIVNVYTEEYGIQSYIVNGVRSQKSKKGLALLQPLTLLDMVVYHNPNKPDGLQRLSEYKPSVHFKSIPFEVKKSSIALFVTELLGNVLKEEEHHGSVFPFLHELIIDLDKDTTHYANIHVFLLVQLTHYIGFGIHNRKELEQHTILHSVNTDYDSIYDAILQFNVLKIGEELSISNGLRQDLLEYMIEYYQLHIEGFKSLKSLSILTQIFR